MIGGMIQSIKENKKLLSKREKSSYYNKIRHPTTEKTEYNLPDVSEEELQIIIEKIRARAKRSEKLTYIWMAIAVVLASALSYWLITTLHYIK